MRIFTSSPGSEAVADVALQAGLVPVFAKALAATGLLDPTSAQTGLRVSEEILLILATLSKIPSARASTSSLLQSSRLITV